MVKAIIAWVFIGIFMISCTVGVTVLKSEPPAVPVERPEEGPRAPEQLPPQTPTVPEERSPPDSGEPARVEPALSEPTRVEPALSEPIRVEPPAAPPERPQMDRIVERIKANSGIEKQFELSENSKVTVSARIEEGADIFEAVYDLENAWFMGDAGMRVDFSVTNIKTGAMSRDSFIWKIGEDDAGVLLGFDDDFIDVWESYFDLFDKYNAKVTFFVQGEYSDFCGRAQSRGHEVGYHTLHHLNLPKIPLDEFLTETLSAVDGFRKNGIPLLSFAYPFGLFEPWMNEMLSSSFTILRGYGTTFRIYHPSDIKQGYISSKAIDNLLFKKEEDFTAMINIVLRTAKFLSGDAVVPLTTHTISDTANWGISPARLEYVLKTVNDLKLKWYRYSDF
ncbi:MAG: polysaccharide deacetylase family protein [Treponema sp.]|jgi:hypothetical protein|nr:polysaccharide deacetylase family protein [Treponema sp.]